MREWSTETDNAKFHIPAIPYGNRNIMVENESENFSENREESQIAEPLCTNGTTHGRPDAPFAPGTCKSTRENFRKPAKK